MQTENKITALYYRTAPRAMHPAYIDNQMQKLLCYAQEHLSKSFVLYADNGVSGNTFDRPALNALKADVAAGRVGEIILNDLARLGRSFAAANGLIAWMQSCGVKVTSLSEDLQTANLNEDAKIARRFARALDTRRLEKGGE
jgi:DNA invertase Pin-like site-specific DNA recombinase